MPGVRHPVECGGTMRTLSALTTVILAALVAGCATKPKEFKELVSGQEQKQDLEKSLSESSRSIIVSIDKERRLYLNKESIGTIDDANQLKRKLPQLFEEKGNKAVFMFAPRSISKDDLGRVIDAVKEAGAHPVGLSREDK
jgi:biopolymer transport protein ExbD